VIIQSWVRNFAHYLLTHAIYAFRFFCTDVVDLLATKFTGVIPNEICKRKLENDAAIVRVECPMSCDWVENDEGILIGNGNASNDCGGFGSEFCSSNLKWRNFRFNFDCDFVTSVDAPNCPIWGISEDDSGFEAYEACCHCGGGICETCYNSTEKECTNDKTWTAIVKNETVSCDWFEDNDLPGCANTYLDFLSIPNVNDPRISCCYCSAYCQDASGWRDGRSMWSTKIIVPEDVWNGYSCTFYETFDDPGCPLLGDRWPDQNNMTAHDACCYCKKNEVSTPSLQDTCKDFSFWEDEEGRDCDYYEMQDDFRSCRRRLNDIDENGISANDACCYCGGGMNYSTANPSISFNPSGIYAPSSLPSINPTDCYDYFGWLDVNGEGCDDYNMVRCLNQGQDQNVDGINAIEACCQCGGGTAQIPSVMPSNKYDPSATPSVNPTGCYDYIDWVDENGNECDDYNTLLCLTQGQNQNNYGVDAIEACCHCGGGTLKIPSSTPSHKYNPSTTPSTHPTSCYDYIGWVDDNGNQCGDYNSLLCLNQGLNQNNHGVSAIEACCQCGGGAMNIPSSIPSSECYDFTYQTYDVSDIKDNVYKEWSDILGRRCSDYANSQPRGCPNSHAFLPGQYNITAEEACCHCGGGTTEPPGNSTYVNETCLNYIDWRDAYGAACTFYEGFGYYLGCEVFGPLLPSDGASAIDACCFCGGGLTEDGFETYEPRFDQSDETWRNSVTLDSLPGENHTCELLDYYFSGDNDALKDYCKQLHNGTTFMDEVCLVCDIASDKISEENFCKDKDLQVPKPWPEKNCDWYSRTEYSCDEFGNLTMFIEDDIERTANEVCCVCGGGTQDCKEFNPDWTDSHPDASFSCNDYDVHGRCAADGSGLISFGHNANTQCCVCGGGYTSNDEIITYATNKTCVNEHEWEADDKNCSYFADDILGSPDVGKCLSFGHLTSIHGVAAFDGCCSCWYGYEDNLAGGYRGALIGKMLRFSVMNYTDLRYVHNIMGSDDIDGGKTIFVTENSTIYKFVRTASSSYGFGLIYYDLNALNETRALGSISDDPYSGCLSGMLEVQMFTL